MPNQQDVDGRDKPGHDVATKCLSFFKHDDEVHCLSSVMPAHSRPKDGVLSHAYVAGIHVFLSASIERTTQCRNLCRNFARVTTEFRFFVCVPTVVLPVQVFPLSRP